jgi:7,8-dihydropterin-6-yl-methyl-4-(beta-D-ribofuranosyl)aminobenzene 5'-phosphate synthase
LSGAPGVTSAAPTTSAAPAKAQITVLYDAFGRDSSLHKDWGYITFIERSRKRILFDTGNNPDILARNAQARQIDLSKLDFVAMSPRQAITREACPTC